MDDDGLVKSSLFNVKYFELLVSEVFFKLPPLVGIYAGCTVYVTRVMKGDLSGSGSGLRLIIWLHNNGKICSVYVVFMTHGLHED